MSRLREKTWWPQIGPGCELCCAVAEDCEDVVKPSGWDETSMRRGGQYVPPKINMTVEKQPFEDLSPIKSGNFPYFIIHFFRGVGPSVS